MAARRALLLGLLAVQLTPSRTQAEISSEVESDEWLAEPSPSEKSEARRLMQDERTHEEKVAGRSAGQRPGGHKKKGRRKSWLSMMMGTNTDNAGPNQSGKPMKLPKLSLEEILTGAFVIAVGGLMMSFSI